MRARLMFDTLAFWLAVFALWATWFASYGDASFSRASDQFKRRVEQSGPPPALFGVVWTLLYALNTFAGAVFFARHDEVSNDVFSATLAVYLVNVALNKAWTPLFFGAQKTCLALFDILLTLATAIAVLVLFGYTSTWLAFGLYVPYVLWLVAALGLNARFIVTQQ